ncbi:MAG: thioesterase [Marmoricola sp.]|nr:thioesterase [Marmoricola sp.]
MRYAIFIEEWESRAGFYCAELGESVKGSQNIRQYIETARIAWLEGVGALPDPSATGPVLINAQCSFLKQLKYPAEIEVSSYVGPPGRSSFEVSHEIRLVGADGEAGALHAEGAAKIVWVDFAAEKSVPLPEAIRSLLPAG